MSEQEIQQIRRLKQLLARQWHEHLHVCKACTWEQDCEEMAALNLRILKCEYELGYEETT